MADRKIIDECTCHTDHENRIARNGADIQDLWKEVNGMKKFAIMGMSSAFLQLLLFLGMVYLSSKG